MAEFLSKYQCKNPVVLIVFNRPEKTAVLLERLKQVTPGKIYVISDGPRENRKDDLLLVDQVRSLIDEKIDWDCNLNKIYSPKNLSGPIRVPSGFDEVFATEKQAIILEDDCIPSVSFFRFCDELLDKYSTDQRIG
ncbi:MAG: nucleotide-diphospho-sugar transferase, partial [Cyclobacteriaceae bacterium]